MHLFFSTPVWASKIEGYEYINKELIKYIEDLKNKDPSGKKVSNVKAENRAPIQSYAPLSLIRFSGESCLRSRTKTAAANPNTPIIGFRKKPDLHPHISTNAPPSTGPNIDPAPTIVM